MPKIPKIPSKKDVRRLEAIREAAWAYYDALVRAHGGADERARAQYHVAHEASARLCRTIVQRCTVRRTTM